MAHRPPVDDVGFPCPFDDAAPPPLRPPVHSTSLLSTSDGPTLDEPHHAADDRRSSAMSFALDRRPDSPALSEHSADSATLVDVAAMPTFQRPFHDASPGALPFSSAGTSSLLPHTAPHQRRSTDARTFGSVSTVAAPAAASASRVANAGSLVATTGSFLAHSACARPTTASSPDGSPERRSLDVTSTGVTLGAQQAPPPRDPTTAVACEHAPAPMGLHSRRSRGRDLHPRGRALHPQTRPRPHDGTSQEPPQSPPSEIAGRSATPDGASLVSAFRRSLHNSRTSSKVSDHNRSYTKLFVGQVPRWPNAKEWLEELFAPFGVREIHVRSTDDRVNAFVWCQSREAAEAAVAALNGHKYQNRRVWYTLCVEPSHSGAR